MTELIDGPVPASPTPVPNRASAIVQKPRAKLDSSVIRLNTASDAAMMLRRLKRSASTASGTPRIA